MSDFRINYITYRPTAKMEEEEDRGPLFQDVVFTIIPSEHITEEQTNDVRVLSKVHLHPMSQAY